MVHIRCIASSGFSVGNTLNVWRTLGRASAWSRGEEGDADLVGLLNARLGIANPGQGWELSVFASNLLDEEYLVDAGNTGGSFGNPTFVAGPPRFWGVQLDYDFGAY